MGLKALNRLITGAPDYETGSWTPTLGVMSGTDGVHTYSVQVGRYIRIGNLVWIHGHINISTLDGAMSGNAAIKGLPFTASSVAALNGPVSVIAVNGVNFDANYTVLRLRLGNGTTRFEVIEEGDNAAAASVAHTQFGTPHIMFAGTYSTGLS